MKKLVVAILILAVASLCYADNLARIAELDKEGKELQERAMQYTQQIKQIQDVLGNIQVRLIQIDAIKNELARQDTAKPEDTK